MRKFVLAAAMVATMGFAGFATTTPASAQSIEPGCSPSIGGLCGRDLASWCRTFATIRHGRLPLPAECLGQGRPYAGRVLMPRGIPLRMQPRIVQQIRTPIIAINQWHRRCFGDGHCVCISGNCPPQ